MLIFRPSFEQILKLKTEAHNFWPAPTEQVSTVGSADLQIKFQMNSFWKVSDPLLTFDGSIDF